MIEVNNRRVELTVPLDVVANLTGGTHARAAQLPTQPLRGQGMHHVERKEAHDERPGVISAPMQAIVTRITVAPGQAVAKGDLLVVLESMKMENYVYAPAGGTVTEIFAAPATGVEAGVAPGQAVAKGDLLVVLESMKMENYVYAPAGGTVTEIFAAPATGVEAGETLLTMDVAGARHRARIQEDGELLVRYGRRHRHRKLRRHRHRRGGGRDAADDGRGGRAARRRRAPCTGRGIRAIR